MSATSPEPGALRPVRFDLGVSELGLVVRWVRGGITDSEFCDALMCDLWSREDASQLWRTLVEQYRGAAGGRLPRRPMGDE